MAGRRRRRDGPEGTRRGKTWQLIYGHYKEALDALPLEHIPALAPRLVDAGVCFGFADPVTNIIANTVCVHDEDGEPVPICAKKRKREKMTEIKAFTEAAAREEVLSKIGDDKVQTIADRSLRGLVVFLTSYFRHLSNRDALRYLYLARANLLVAVRLIELDRCYRRKDRFCICSYATKTALRCAALSARMPMVDSFVSSSFGLVPHLKLVIKTVAAEPRRCLSVRDVHYLSGLLKEPLKLKKSDNPMSLAPIRIPQHDADASTKVLGVLTPSLRCVLLDRIHDLYLKAVSQLPMEDFRTRYHRGLLKAGYCYGPFNPVSNIIVNTIWYDTTFPASQGLEVDMICTMRHVESRSLSGLLAFLRASIPEVSEHEAMTYLLKNDLKVGKAIKMAAKQGHYKSGSDESSYKAAANASSHPKAEEYLEFAVQSLPTMMSDVRSLMQASQMISSRNILRLSRLLSPSSAEPLESPLKLTQDAVDMLSKYKKDFLTEQTITRGKVEAALQNYEETMGCCYELRIICGVNNCVGKQRKIRDPKRQYSHVNFWASLKNGGSPTLFFAQFNNDEGCENQSICCPVSDQSTCDVRCCYCESQGIRIVHPIQSYWEGGSEFEKVCCGEHQITNAKIVSRGKRIDNQVMGIFRQHYLYQDPLWDCGLTPHINRIAWHSTRTWEDLMRDAIDQKCNKFNEDHDRMLLQRYSMPRNNWMDRSHVSKRCMQAQVFP
ncbi:hypothetical protein EJB05_56826 [Eragrostis curvula]|uniref:Uncharacterized protein n=1 Tax=Eragrostis curvula TaxID=38414 RepID=A0A5J9SF54_9POAL|nr:hypothetical protein EJB05_56826 [Eragrostis curvula]